MSFYPAAINERLRTPKCGGELAAANASAASASFICGAFARISLRIDSRSTSISHAKFLTNGCGYMTAAADVICGWLANKQLGDLHGLAERELMELVEEKLGPFPTSRQQCAAVAFDALRAAMAAYRQDRIGEFRGESALICSCFGVSEETILNMISANGLKDVDEVSRVCRAGSGCGSCRMLIQELIDSTKV